MSNYDQGTKPFLTPEQGILARRIKFNYHAMCYLQDMAGVIQNRLLDYPEDTDYGRVHDYRAADRPAYQVRRRIAPATTRRRLDHPGLADKLPEIYRRAVRETPPVRKFGLYFSRGRFEPWKVAKLQAIEGTRQKWEQQTAKVSWTTRAAVVDILFQVRKELRISDARNQELRDTLSGSIDGMGFPGGLVYIPDHATAYIDAKPMAPKKVVDWGIVEACPAAQEFVTHTPVSGFTAIMFTKIQPDPDEGDKQPFEGY